MQNSNSNWLGAPVQAVVVGAYLLSVVIASVIALFIFFPQDEFDTSVRKKREFTVPVIDDSLGLHVEFQPDIRAALTDTVTMNFQVLDRYGKPVFAIPPASYAIPPEIISNDILVLLVLLVGALGASLYGLTSLVEYVGNNSYVNSWTMWYLLRPFAGAVLSLVFYLAGRAGLFDVVDTQNELFSVLALSGLIGLFSKQALFKLSDIFDVLFRSNKEGELRDKLDSGAGTVPVIATIEPSRLKVNTADRTIRVKGTNFAKDAVVQVNRRSLETARTGAGLSATLDESDVAEVRVLQITVLNPGSLGMFSKPVELKVEEAGDEGEEVEGG